MGKAFFHHLGLSMEARKPGSLSKAQKARKEKRTKAKARKKEERTARTHLRVGNCAHLGVGNLAHLRVGNLAHLVKVKFSTKCYIVQSAKNLAPDTT
jgi:sRNA-binding protein